MGGLQNVFITVLQGKMITYFIKFSSFKGKEFDFYIHKIVVRGLGNILLKVINNSLELEAWLVLKP